MSERKGWLVAGILAVLGLGLLGPQVFRKARSEGRGVRVAGPNEELPVAGGLSAPVGEPVGRREWEVLDGGAPSPPASNLDREESETPWKVFGRVLGEGQGIPDAEVRVSLDVGEEGITLGETRTDADGSYSLDSIARPVSEGGPLERSLTVWADAPGFRSERVNRALERDSGTEFHMDVALRKGFELAGRVVDPGGNGVAGASVLLASGEGALSFAGVLADAGGAYCFPLVERPQRIEAGYVGTGTVARDLRGIPVDRDQFLPDLVLEPGLAIRGRVVCSEGEGLPGLWVGAQPEMLRGATSIPWAMTDDLGTFEVIGLDAQSYELNANVGDGLMSFGTFPAGSEGLSLTLDRRCLEVLVRTAEGDPVLGIAVEALSGSLTPVGGFERRDRYFGRAEGDEATARFWIPPQDSAIVLYAGESSGRVERLVRPEERGSGCVGRVVLVSSPRARTALRLEVRDETDRPVPWELCSLDSVLTGENMAAFGPEELDSEGWMRDLPSGRFRLSVDLGSEFDSEGYLLDTALVHPVELLPGGERELELPAKTGGRLELLFRGDPLAGEEGEAIEISATLTAPMEEDHGFLRFLREEEGRGNGILLGFPALVDRPFPPGPYLLSVEAAGYLDVEQPVTVRAGRTTRIRVDLLPE